MLLTMTFHDDRKEKRRDVRRDGMWHEHIEKLEHLGEAEFISRYTMTKKSFDKLVDLLGEAIDVDETKSMASTQGVAPIAKELVVAIGLRALSGSHTKDLVDIFHISRASVKRVARKFREAVLECDELSMDLPEGEEELEQVANHFTQKSTANGIYHGVIGAIDGFLAMRNVPHRSEVTNTADYYSGHKKIHALNVQAMVDSMLRFRYVCIAGPGKMNDGRAFLRCRPLRQWLEALPNKYFIIGDAAYPLSNKLLVPFRGTLEGEEWKQSYNFYLSQLRIRVEMAFGRLTTKFRILRKRVECRLVTQSEMIQVCCRLHNFVIDNDGLPVRQRVVVLTADGQIPEEELDQWGIDHFPVGPANNNGFLEPLNADQDQNQQQQQPNVARRNQFVEQLQELELLRPYELNNNNNIS